MAVKRLIRIPTGVEVLIEANRISVKGPAGELARTFPVRDLIVQKKNGEVEVLPRGYNARVRALTNTFKSHILNMLAGVQKPFVYRLKVCYTHFPIAVQIVGNVLELENFIGGKKTKRITLLAGINARVEGDIITIESHDKELAGNAAAMIERASQIRRKDRRVFQDGIYIIEKAGKNIL